MLVRLWLQPGKLAIPLLCQYQFSFSSVGNEVEQNVASPHLPPGSRHQSSLPGRLLPADSCLFKNNEEKLSLGFVPYVSSKKTKAADIFSFKTSNLQDIYSFH